MTKVLLPLDISHPTEPVVEHLSSILPLGGSDVHGLYVNEAWPAYENVIATAGDFADDWKHKLEEKAQAAFAQTKVLLGGKCVSFTSEIVTGPPAMMIESVARDEHVDITVVSPGKHSMLAEKLLGSVSPAVVKHCRGTILVLRGAAPSGGKLRVVIGLDGSPNSREALKRAIDEFDLKRPGVEIVLVHAADVASPVKLVSPVEFISCVEQNLLMEGETYLADGKRTLADNGITRVDMVLKPGRPADVILEVAKAVPADLVVLGAEGRTAVQHFLLGSVSERIAHLAPCSVAIIKRKYSPT